jgi:2-keto-4-pentenoate hydratase
MSDAGRKIMTSRLATALWKARTEGGVVAVEDSERPADEATAYAIQDEITALFDAEPVGWKLGATNDKTLKLLGVERPFVGRLLSMHFHAMGDPLIVFPEHGPSLETEFLVSLAADLPPRGEPYSDEEVAGAVEYICPAFEVVGCRVEGGLPGAGGLLLIADGAVNMAVVQGEPAPDWRSADLSDHPLRVEINGTEVAAGSSNLLLWGNPYGAVAYLAGHPQVAGRGLRKGDRIMTGTCGGLLPLAPGDEGYADFGVLGSVSLKVAGG